MEIQTNKITWMTPQGEPIRKSDLKVGKRIIQIKTNDNYIITDVLKNGKFKGIKEDKLESLIEDDGYAYDTYLPLNSYPTVWKNDTETFGIS